MLAIKRVASDKFRLVVVSVRKEQNKNSNIYDLQVYSGDQLFD